MILWQNWWQARLDDLSYEFEPFRIAKEANPEPVLFLNEPMIVSSSMHTSALANQALRFKKADVGLGALGAQSHLYPKKFPNPVAIKVRIEYKDFSMFFIIPPRKVNSDCI